jgi:hypothetical protein
MTARVRLRWRTNASGYVASFAGHWAHPGTFTREQAEEYVRMTPNGHHIEIVEEES